MNILLNKTIIFVLFVFLICPTVNSPAACWMKKVKV